MLASRVLAVTLALALAGPRPLHAQDPPAYTIADADADVAAVLRTTGADHDAAHARLLAHPELALTRVYARTGHPAGLTPSEREGLAAMAEALAGTEARVQILNPPLQVVPPEPAPADAPQPAPFSAPAAPTWRPLLVFGPLFLGAGALLAGIGAHGLRTHADEPRPDDRCKCDGRTDVVFVGAGLVFAGVGTWLLARGLKQRRDWRERHTLAIAPTVGRSARGTVTAGLELRF